MRRTAATSSAKRIENRIQNPIDGTFRRKSRETDTDDGTRCTAGVGMRHRGSPRGGGRTAAGRRGELREPAPGGPHPDHGRAAHPVPPARRQDVHQPPAQPLSGPAPRRHHHVPDYYEPDPPTLSTISTADHLTW